MYFCTQRAVVIWSGSAFAQRESDADVAAMPPPAAVAAIVPPVMTFSPDIIGALAIAGRAVGAVGAAHAPPTSANNKANPENIFVFIIEIPS
jgi:hypothetical protein